MTEHQTVDAGKLLKGKITPEDLTTRYVAIYHMKLSRAVEAVNHLEKYGWRAVGIGATRKGATVLMERIQ